MGIGRTQATAELLGRAANRSGASMKRGETKDAMIGRIIDDVWKPILARQAATYREHHPTTLEFIQPSLQAVDPGTWIYTEKRVALGVLARCKTYIRSTYGRYAIPSRFLVLVSRREATNQCPCAECVAVRERKEMAVAA
jgi:hypothetical protein